MMRFSMIAVVLLSALVFLQYRLWFESGGIGDTAKLKQALAVQEQVNEKLKKQNDELLFQIQRLQVSQDATESRARSELGMVKKGETFYQIIK